MEAKNIDNMEPKELYVITRSEEHADYVEKVFTDESKAIAYCLQFKADENRYQRDMTTVKLTEDNELIPITCEILKGIGFEERARLFYSLTIIDVTITVQYFSLYDSWRISTRKPNTLDNELSIKYLYELVCIMQMSGINVKQLLKP